MTDSTFERLSNAVRAVSYPGYTFELLEREGRFFLRGCFLAPCAKSGQVEEQFTRRWPISRLATRSEVVQTALKLVLTSLEHEAREVFTYRGCAIFGPHFDVETLHRVCGEEETR